MVYQFKLAVVGAVLVLARWAGAEVPQYRFVPGQELSYRIDWTIRYSAPDRSALHDDYADAVARVVRKNGDGSYRMLIRWKETSAKTANGAQTFSGPWSDVFCLDVFPDGRELQTRDRGLGTMPGMLFPPLPRNDQELRNGWTAKLQDFTYACTADAGKSEYQFRGTIDAPVMQRLHDSRSTRYSFDNARGLVSNSVDTFVRDNNPNGAGTGTTQLVAVKVIPDAELARLTKDMDTYSAASEAYNQRMKHAGELDTERARDVAHQAETEFKAAVEKIADGDLKAAGDRVLARHSERLESVLASISRGATRH